MPRLWITEYRELASDGRGTVIQLPSEPSHTQVVDFGAPTLSAPFRRETAYVRLVSNADCFVEFGNPPQAAGSKSEFLPARGEAFRRVRGGQRLSVYDGGIGDRKDG